MTYKLRFHKQTLKEWEKLEMTIQLQFKKKLAERLENPKDLLRLHDLKLPLETIALALDLPADSVQTILKGGFKAMEQMYREEKISERDEYEYPFKAHQESKL